MVNQSVLFLYSDNEIIDNNLTNNNTNKESKSNKHPREFFIPKQKDSLFWCFYIMKNGDANYEMLEHKNIITDKKLKIDYVEKIRKEKMFVQFRMKQ